MEFLEKLSEKIKENRDSIMQTEEATKTNLILPFIQYLGYDIFNVSEVQPECSNMSGERVDFVIHNGECKILVECKKLGTDLSQYWSQLFSYYAKTDARFAILTDGQRYLFYTDSENRNKMDRHSFAEIDITNLPISDTWVIELIQKGTFDESRIFSTAFSSYIKGVIYKEVENILKNPPSSMIGAVSKRIVDKGSFTKRQIDDLIRETIISFSSKTDMQEMKMTTISSVAPKFDNTDLEQKILTAVLSMEPEKRGVIQRKYKAGRSHNEIGEIAYGTRNKCCWVLHTYKWTSKPIVEIAIKTDKEVIYKRLENSTDIMIYKDSISDAYNNAFKKYRLKTQGK